MMVEIAIQTAEFNDLTVEYASHPSMDIEGASKTKNRWRPTTLLSKMSPAKTRRILLKTVIKQLD